MSISPNFATHLRKVHFILMATCSVGLTAAWLDPSQEISRAHQDVENIRKIKEGLLKEGSYKFVDNRAQQIVDDEIKKGSLPVKIAVDLEQNVPLAEMKVYSRRAKECVRLGDIRVGELPIKGIIFDLLESGGRPYAFDAEETLDNLGDFEKLWNGNTTSKVVIPWGFPESGIAHVYKPSGEECPSSSRPPQTMRVSSTDISLKVRPMFLNRSDLNHSEEEVAHATTPTVLFRSVYRDPDFLARKKTPDGEIAKQKIFWELTSVSFGVKESSTPNTFAWSGFIHLNEAKTIPIVWRDEFRLTQNGRTWRNDGFSATFPELQKYGQDLKKLPLDDLEHHLFSLIKRDRGRFELLGVKIPPQYTNWAGVLIIFCVQYYFFLHLKEFLRAAGRADSSMGEPWVGFYTDWWAKISIFLTVVLFPPGVSSLLLHNEISQGELSSIAYALMIPSVAIAIYSVYMNWKLWKRCDRRIALRKTVVNPVVK